MEEWIIIDWHFWEISDGVSKRLAWIQIIGSPIHCWNKCFFFFQWLVNDFGVMVEVAPTTINRKRLDIARSELELHVISSNFQFYSGNREIIVQIRE